MKFLVLKKIHLSWFIFLTLLWLLSCQLLFLFLQTSLGEKTLDGIKNQFRDELNSTNFHFLARAVSDLNQAGSVRCTTLTKLLPHDELQIMSTSYLGGCGGSDFTLDGRHFDTKIRTINGDEYQISFISNNPQTFFLALWSFRILGVLTIASLGFAFLILKENQKIAFEKEISLARQRELFSKQVAHDIRSPLTALNMLLNNLNDLPENQKILLRNSANRINDIANILLKKTDDSSIFKSESIEGGGAAKMQTEFLPALVDGIISEKRLEYIDKTGVTIKADFSESYGAFVRINSSDFARLISNITNNAIEALPNKGGSFIISISKIKGAVKLIAEDTGKGIPKHILAKIGEAGFSFGKEHLQSGSGLGVYHAKKTIEDFGGTFKIDSQVGVGTSILITLPLVESPKWFVEKISLSPACTVVILDDDLSIHDVWKEKIRAATETQGVDIQILNFTSCEEIKKWIANQSKAINKEVKSLRFLFEDFCFLFDYEIGSKGPTGLNLIEEYGIAKSAFLVTSRFEELAIQNKCTELSVGLIPKNMIPYVPFQIRRTKRN